jgi:hypothetical protein
MLLRVVTHSVLQHWLHHVKNTVRFGTYGTGTLLIAANYAPTMKNYETESLLTDNR